LLNKDEYLKFLHNEMYKVGSNLHADLKRYKQEKATINIDYAYNPYILNFTKIFLKSQHLDYHALKLEENYKNHIEFYKTEAQSENTVHAKIKNILTKQSVKEKTKAKEYILYKFQQLLLNQDEPKSVSIGNESKMISEGTNK